MSFSSLTNMELVPALFMLAGVVVVLWIMAMPDDLNRGGRRWAGFVSIPFFIIWLGLLGRTLMLASACQ